MQVLDSRHHVGGEVRRGEQGVAVTPLLGIWHYAISGRDMRTDVSNCEGGKLHRATIQVLLV